MKYLLAVGIAFFISICSYAEDKPAVTDAQPPAAAEPAPPAKAAEPEAKAVPPPISAPAPEAAAVKEVKPEPVAGFVAPIQGLVAFHEKEIASLNKMFDRWSAKTGVTLKRRQSMVDDIQSMTLKLAELQKEGTKTSRNESDRIKKQITRAQKDVATIDKELKAQAKELAGELKEDSQLSQQALRDAYQQAALNVQKP